MDIYASATQSALLTTEFSVEKIQARSVLEQYSANRLLMRYLRYYQFPQSIISHFADIHHVLDHGYAHLVPKFKQGKTVVTVHDLSLIHI